MLTKVVDRERLKGATATGLFDSALWASLCDLGWVAGAVPVDLDGYGTGLTGPCVVAEELGRTCAAVPFGSSILALELLAACPPSSVRSSIATTVLGGRVAAVHLRGGLEQHAGQVTGTVPAVHFGGAAEILVAAASDSAGGPRLVAIALEDSLRTPLATSDPSTPLATIRLTDAACETLADGDDVAEIVGRAELRAAVVVAFEQLGGAQRCLEVATEYVAGRYQFGRPVGSFQAVKHKLANVLVAVELARSLCYGALWASEQQTEGLGAAASLCWLAAADAYRLAAEEGLHLHGGIGFTWEADAHLYLRRSATLAGLFGSRAAWVDRAAECVLGTCSTDLVGSSS